MIDVALLGTGGTLPLPDRFLSAALIRCGGQLVLIDCGEGTQESLRVIAPHLPYPVRYRELTGDPADALAVGPLRVTTCPADHDIPCLAYRLGLSRAPAFQPERAKALGLPVILWKLLQRGEPVE